MTSFNVKLFAWGGIASLLLFLAGFLLAGFIPPSPAPGLPARDMADYFREHPLQIRLGLLLTQFGAALLVPWTVAISVQIARTEGTFRPLAWAQMLLGTLLTIEFLIPFQILMNAAYRPNRTDELIQSLIDQGWLMFMGITSTLLLQGLIMGLAILQDKRRTPVFPRWSGYFSIWAVIIAAPGALVPFFKEGPFTWQGMFVWWIPLGVFGPWIITFSVLTIRAAKFGTTAESSSASDDVDPRYASAAEVAALRSQLAQLADSGDGISRNAH